MMKIYKISFNALLFLTAVALYHHLATDIIQYLHSSLLLLSIFRSLLICLYSFEPLFISAVIVIVAQCCQHSQSHSIWSDEIWFVSHSLLVCCVFLFTVLHYSSKSTYYENKQLINFWNRYSSGWNERERARERNEIGTWECVSEDCLS